MAARFQRLLLLLVLCAAAGSAAILICNDRPWWGSMVAVMILSVYPTLLAVELVLAAVVARRVSSPSLVPLSSFQDLVRAWSGEILAGLMSFVWEQPFRSRAEPDFMPESARGRRGVVLVHGLLCNRGFWNRWMQRLRIKGGVAFTAVNLEPLFGSIDHYIDTLDSAVTRVTAATGMAPVVVAHSMGGLVVRRWLRQQASTDRVHRVVTIGTPHAGTWLARFAASLNGRQMAIGSAWLQSLQSQSRQDDAAVFTCFYGNCDNVVFPPVNATLAGADNRLLRASAHVQLACRPEVFNEMLRWLDCDYPLRYPRPHGLNPPAAPVTAQKTGSDGNRSVAVNSESEATRS